jgi:hypothetical protein
VIKPTVVAMTLLAVTASPSIPAQPQQVRGFFCNAKTDVMAFLAEMTRGQNEVMAANTVNKKLGAMSCAYYLPAHADSGKPQTVFDGGIVFQVQSHVFYPEHVERWSGTFFGALEQRTDPLELNL